MDKTLDKQLLTPALLRLKNAQLELVYAVRAFERTGGNFDGTIKNIKENIGDLLVCTTALEDLVALSLDKAKEQDND